MSEHLDPQMAILHGMERQTKGRQTMSEHLDPQMAILHGMDRQNEIPPGIFYITESVLQALKDGLVEASAIGDSLAKAGWEAFYSGTGLITKQYRLGGFSLYVQTRHVVFNAEMNAPIIVAMCFQDIQNALAGKKDLIDVIAIKTHRQQAIDLISAINNQIMGGKETNV